MIRRIAMLCWLGVCWLLAVAAWPRLADDPFPECDPCPWMAVR